MYAMDPRLLIYPRKINAERVFTGEAYSATPPLILRHPSILDACLQLPHQFTATEAQACWKEIDFAGVEVELVWQALVESKILRPVTEIDSVLPSAKAWRRFGWAEAFSYHAAVRDYPFLRMDTVDAFETDDLRMQGYAAASSIPSIYQELPSSGHVQLRKIDSARGASETFEALSSEERTGLPGLGFLFDLCFGEREQRAFKFQGSFLRKAIPSGGARHPTEIFFIALAGAPVLPGVYHYNVRRHSLDRLRDGDLSEVCADATFDLFKKFDRKPQGLLVFTSLYERPMWRYRDARSWRAVLIDVGHALMIFRVVSRSLGFQHYTYQKFKDDIVADLLNLNPIRQTPLFVSTLV